MRSLIVVLVSLTCFAFASGAFLVLDSDGRCTGVYAFRMDCNNCTCSGYGEYPDCGKMACDHTRDGSDSIVIDSEFLDAQGRCTGPSSFKQDCNYCSCGAWGYYPACTLMACPSGVQEEANNQVEPGVAEFLDAHGRCTGKYTFKWDCNYCSCGASGYYPACTLMACHGQGESNNQVEPGVAEFLDVQGRCEGKYTFKWNCNYCSCGAAGYYPACTLMACPKNKRGIKYAKEETPNYISGAGPPENGYELGICKGNFSWTNDCRSCICIEDKVPDCSLGCPSGEEHSQQTRPARAQQEYVPPENGYELGICQRNFTWTNDYRVCACVENKEPVCSLTTEHHNPQGRPSGPSQQYVPPENGYELGICQRNFTWTNDYRVCACVENKEPVCSLTTEHHNPQGRPGRSPQNENGFAPFLDAQGNCTSVTRFGKGCIKCNCLAVGSPPKCNFISCV